MLTPGRETRLETTERKLAEKELRASGEHWKAVFDNNPTMVLIVDSALAILSVNAFGAEQLGYTAGELVGRPVQFLIHEADREYALKQTAACLEHFGRTVSWELRKLRKDGSLIWARETGRAMLIKSQPAVLVVSEDITEAKRAAEALREMQTQLAHANSLQTAGQLAASIAHEVNQPIAATVTNADAALRWLGRDPPDLDEVRQALNRIARDGARAGAVIQRIREHVKKAQPREDRVELNAAVREVIAFAGGEAIKNGVSVRAELVEGSLPIRGDRVGLRQVVLNLVSNAIEAMSRASEGPRELRIATGRTETGDVLIAVRDTGPGLTPSIQQNLFKAFETTKPDGLGLGLSICRSIVEAHGGCLRASANTPRGAVFELTLPSLLAEAPRE